MMRTYLIVALAAGMAVSAAARHRDSGSPGPSIPLIPVQTLGVEGVIFPQERGGEAIIGEKIARFWTPSAQDVERLETQLRPFVESVRADPSIGYRWRRLDESRATTRSREFGKILEHFSEYRRQYVGIFVGSSKRIFVNCFLALRPDGTDYLPQWRQRFVWVNDGGYWFWQAEYDVSLGRFVLIDSNGYA